MIAALLRFLFRPKPSVDLRTEIREDNLRRIRRHLLASGPAQAHDGRFEETLVR